MIEIITRHLNGPSRKVLGYSFLAIAKNGTGIEGWFYAKVKTSTAEESLKKNIYGFRKKFNFEW